MNEVGQVEQRTDEYACALCGHTASGKFVGDICPQCGLTYFRCAACGYLLTASSPPDVCPECMEKYDFLYAFFENQD